MPLSEQALSVVTRPLMREQIKQRPGKAGMIFNYISADLVIELLNEAFEHRWSTAIISSAIHDRTAVVGLELTVWDREENSIHKQQFGSCEMNAGMGPGEAFKGAASDALKKAATLLGIGLELYQDGDTASAAPRLPQTQSRPTPPKAPSAPSASRAPVTPPRGPAALTSPAPAAAPPRPAAPRAPATPPSGNPFASGTSGTTASVPAPPKPVAPAAPAPPRANPFASAAATASGPNSTQMNAMTNLAARKNLSQPEMVALAGVSDEQGNAVTTFEELTHAQAIQVIKAAQL